MRGTLADKPHIARLAVAGLWRRLARRLRSGPVARWRFTGIAPDRILIAPPDLRTPDLHRAAEFYAGRIVLAGRAVETGGQSPFLIDPPDVDWAAALHSFRWLRHMRAEGSDLSSAHARALAADWIRLHGRRVEGLAWDAGVTARRVIAWLQHSGALLRGSDLAFYRSFLRSLAMQLRYLRATAAGVENAESRLLARIAVALAALSLPASPARLSTATRHLEAELKTQILPDGIHVSRNPDMLLELLTDLLPLRQTYAAQSQVPPQDLVAAIERMLPAVRFFRHADGSMARFNGAGHAAQERIAAVLRFDESAGAPLGSAPHGGYQRLAMGSVTVIADTGSPPPVGASDEANAGCLSFELSSGRHCYIVNAGTDRFGPADFRLLARTTAAHSTATVNDLSSCRFAADGPLRALYGTPILAGPRTVTANRADDIGVQAFAASHDGFLSAAGIVHHRSLALSHNGSVLEGVDRCLAANGYPLRANAAANVAIRFHLHPQVNLVTNDDGQLMLLADRDDTWVFTCSEIAPKVENSVFFSDVSGPRKNRVIVLEFDAAAQPEVHWQLTRTALGAWSQ